MNLAATLLSRKQNVQIIGTKTAPSIGETASAESQKSAAQNLQIKAGNLEEIQKSGSARSIAEEGIKGRIKKLLISGAIPAEVSRAVGVSESYISQLMQDANFAKEVLSGRAGTATGKAELNAQYDRVEGKLLTKLESNIPSLYKTGDILNALRVVGSRKREPIVEPPSDAGNRPVVHLHLSQRIAQKFIVNQNKDVIGLGETTFIPMSSTELLKEAVESLPQKQLYAEPENYSNEPSIKNIPTSPRSETKTVARITAATTTEIQSGRRNPKADHLELISSEDI